MRYVVVGMIALVIAGCGDDGNKEDIRIGVLVPKTGRAASIGESLLRVGSTAALTINAEGGIDGHQVVLVARDTGSDAERARTGYLELVEDEQVIAVIGPALSDSVAAVYPEAANKKVPFISPSSTAASLIDVPDDGFMFRNVPNDDLQGVAQAYFLTKATTGPQIQTVTVLHEDGEYGLGLGTKFASEVERQCETCTAPADHQLSFAPGLNLSQARGVLDDLEALAPAPEWIMVVAVVTDGKQLIAAWDEGTGPTRLANVHWFMTDGLRVPDFLTGLPPSMEGMMGTAPTEPEDSDALEVLRAAYNANNLGSSFEDQVFAGNVWDATYLIAAGVAKQLGNGETIGGSGLRDTIFEVSAAPGQIFHAGQWSEMSAALVGGAEIDYDGASGPNDFDIHGEVTGPFEVWEIVDDGAGGFTFSRVLFLSAAELEAQGN